MWLPLACPLPGTWPATQACAPDWESNRQPLDSHAGKHSTTEPHQPGLSSLFKDNESKGQNRSWPVNRKWQHLTLCKPLQRLMKKIPFEANALNEWFFQTFIFSLLMNELIHMTCFQNCTLEFYQPFNMWSWASHSSHS